MFGRLISFAFVCLLFRQAKSTQFTLDDCCQASDCSEGRTCTFSDFPDGLIPRPCEPGDEICSCAQEPNGIQPCIVDVECLNGDVCGETPRGKFCVSQCFVYNEGKRELSEEEKAICDSQPTIQRPCPLEKQKPSDNSDGNPTPSPFSQPMPEPEFDLDVGVEEPVPSGEVVEPTPSEEFEEPTPSEEFEEPTPSEEFDEPISVVEEPVQGAGVAETSPTMEVPEASPTTEVPEATPTAEVTESPEPTDGVCVAVEELDGVQKVFEQDYHAWVLCDTTGSCATPGHMVLWNGVGMMMKSYCDTVGCERKVMAVNSPRWSAGAIRAKTNGLSYTSFAARWESKAEERLLAAVVRLAV